VVAWRRREERRRHGIRISVAPSTDGCSSNPGAPHCFFPYRRKTRHGRWWEPQPKSGAGSQMLQTEGAVLLEEEAFDAELLQEEEAEATAEAERARPGLTMFTDGSRMEDGATGYAVVWKNGQTWEGIKCHMGHNQGAYDAECAALTRALESVSGGYVPDRVTIFTDAQAAIRRMASEEPGPGQQYAIRARKHIAVLRRARPGVSIEIRWCPAHKGIAGNDKADEWAKIAAEKPSTRGVENPGPLPRSLASLKREISEKKWAEARS